MHMLVRRYIKTAIGFLGVGLGIGVWLLIRRELYGVYASPFETSAHTHALLVGFVMEMILGVALWLFPRPEKGDSRYKPRLAETAYWLLTSGTAARVLADKPEQSRKHSHALCSRISTARAIPICQIRASNG